MHAYIYIHAYIYALLLNELVKNYIESGSQVSVIVFFRYCEY